MFDTLAFSKRLQAGDVPANQADAHASAQADLVIAYLLGQVATKEDLKVFATKADSKRFATKEDLKAFATKKDLANLAEKMTARMDKMVTEEKLLLLLELRDKKMTIRLGGMIFAAVAAASALMQFMGGIAGG